MCEQPIERARAHNDQVTIPHPKPRLRDLTRSQYRRLNECGYLYHLYPEATGNIQVDLAEAYEERPEVPE
jgi:hypothetical protein